MKIVKIDNFDRENMSDVLIAENIKLPSYGDAMKNALNKMWSGDDSPDYFILVEDDYKLHIYDPN